MFSTVDMIQRFRNISLHLSAVQLHQTSGNKSGPEFMQARLFICLVLRQRERVKEERTKHTSFLGLWTTRTPEKQETRWTEQAIKELESINGDKKEKDWERRGAAGFAPCTQRVYRHCLPSGGTWWGRRGGGGGLDPHQSHSEPASRHQRGPSPQARNPRPVQRGKDPAIVHRRRMHTHSEPLQLTSLFRVILHLSVRLRTMPKMV